jgi:hypothetical protein
MDRVLECVHFKPRQIRLIKYRRLFLQVHTIADLETAGGIHVDLSFIEGRPRLLSSTSRDLEIRQERPNTQETWVAWRKDCFLWCNVRTGALHQSLGPWTFSSASLRRSWPYYWEPRNERLVVRSSDGCLSHRPFSRGRTGLHFLRFSNRVFSPTEELERHLGFTRIPSHGIDLPPPPVPSQSFEHFLSIQQEWSRRLLPTLVRDISFDEIFQLLCCPSNDAIAACDGSVQSL